MSHRHISPAHAIAITVVIVVTLLCILQGAAHAAPAQQIVQPQAYLVILDATSSMSWNFAGQGTRHGRDVQCVPPNNQQPYCGAGAPWRRIQERRIYAAKQAIRLLIDQLNPNDTMRLIAFSTKGIDTNRRWTSNKRRLRHDLLDIGAYQGKPYRTAGAAPSASALFKARQLLAQMPQTAPNGLPYSQPKVIFITDSIANRFLKANGGWVNRPNDTCPGVPNADEIASCHVGYTSSIPPIPKPITAMVLQADLLKQGATVYVIALASVDHIGLTLVASAPHYPYFAAAHGPEELLQIIAAIPTIVIGSVSGSSLPTAP
jgi:hypothetical protein